jgi:hypothetical protein
MPTALTGGRQFLVAVPERALRGTPGLSYVAHGSALPLKNLANRKLAFLHICSAKIPAN